MHVYQQHTGIYSSCFDHINMRWSGAFRGKVSKLVHNSFQFHPYVVVELLNATSNSHFGFLHWIINRYYFNQSVDGWMDFVWNALICTFHLLTLFIFQSKRAFLILTTDFYYPLISLCLHRFISAFKANFLLQLEHSKGRIFKWKDLWWACSPQDRLNTFSHRLHENPR